jgi:biopolymer transport protein ExbB
MSNLYETLVKGGPIMVPLVALSVFTFSCGMERVLYWTQVLLSERKLVPAVLKSAEYSLIEARGIAERANNTPIGRFLAAPLRLNSPTPETFRLAMEAAGDQEFVDMRKGDKILETTIAIAPLLGLLGTVTGLIATFNNLNIGGGSGGAGSAADMSKAAAGIAEALITTAGGMIVAIIALFFFRVSVTLQAQQMDYFSKVGSELELIYRHTWCEQGLAGEEESATLPTPGGILPHSDADLVGSPHG